MVNNSAVVVVVGLDDTVEPVDEVLVISVGSKVGAVVVSDEDVVIHSVLVVEVVVVVVVEAVVVVDLAFFEGQIFEYCK